MRPDEEIEGVPALEVELLGVNGSTLDCLAALTTVIDHGPRVVGCMFVTSGERDNPDVENHLFVLATEFIDSPRFIVIPSGFTSGYAGTGPTGTSRAILLLDDARIHTASLVVPARLFECINGGRVSHEELLAVFRRQDPNVTMGRNPFQYVDERDMRRAEDRTSWRRWVTPRISRPLVSPGLFDLIDEFERDPRNAIVSGFRRVESSVRTKLQEAGEQTTDQAAVSLINNAFGKNGALRWSDIEIGSSEHDGRREMLTGAFRALRNRRVHHEEDEVEAFEDLQDFYLVARLYDWVTSAEHRPDLAPPATPASIAPPAPQSPPPS